MTRRESGGGGLGRGSGDRRKLRQQVGALKDARIAETGEKNFSKVVHPLMIVAAVAVNFFEV